MPGILERIETAGPLDRTADTLARAANSLLSSGPLKDALHGTWMGHPLHPALTDASAGLLTSATVLDLFGKRHSRATQLLTALGIATALPTAASGLADWSDTRGAERRIGLVHAAGNLASLVAFYKSMGARRRGRSATATGWSLAGGAGLAAAGYLGGHLAYRLGSGVDRTAFVPLPDDWTPVLAEADLKDRTPTVVGAGSSDVLLFRQGADVHAIANTCTHQGGPLGEGQVDPSEGRVTCPWHGSVFDLKTGSVCHGPASAPQPAFETRTSNGKIEVRPRSRR